MADRSVKTCCSCGCTDDRACPGGCAWVVPDDPFDDSLPLCTACDVDPFEADPEDEIPVAMIEGSTTISEVGWTDRNLIVAFKSGGRYLYEDVPRTVAEEMIAAPSPGRYHAAHVKGVYAYRRLG